MIITYKPIATVHSPFKERSGMPIQAASAIGVKGTVTVNEEYLEGLKDLEGFSYIILIYHFHLSNGYKLQISPFLDDTIRGLFSTRAPKRPNSIGFSVVKLSGVEKNVLHVENVDIIDGTPVLDIKPYIDDFDSFTSEKKGWFDSKSKKFHDMRSDNRFK